MTIVCGLEPIAAVGDPPTGCADRNCGEEGPPEGQREIGDEAENCERYPKDFALHESILAGKYVYGGTNNRRENPQGCADFALRYRAITTGC
jgi:hypothetical protein